MVDETSSLDVIARDECVRLLKTSCVGRLAVGRPDGPPVVVPVNYAVDGEVIVFRSDGGTKLDLLRRQPVAFEVDYIDLVTRTGWSVLVTGRAHEGTTWEVGHLSVEPWGPGPKSHWVRIEPIEITGRRISRTIDWALDRSYL